jgi:hypothetical protein
MGKFNDVLYFDTLKLNGKDRYKIVVLSQNAQELIGHLQIKIRLNQRMLLWLSFVTGLIQNFNTASNEKQTILKTGF